MKTNITPELIRAALAHIPANCDRDTWSRVAMAIKSEYPDSIGHDLFTEWSASADSYDTKAARSTWRSVKGGGGVTVATLLRLAKEHGFVLPKGDQVPKAPDPAVIAARERERELARQREAAEADAAHARGADAAAECWGLASDAGASPYLERKGVQAHGVRFTADGWLVIPMRDAAGQLWNVQRIAPAKPADGGPDKLFLTGGRKAGLWHMLGDLGTDEAGVPVLLIAEGYATAASVHQATGLPVAVAFDAGNLVHVAKALHELHPAALIAIAGDDDQATKTRTGRNPGRLAATAAARAVHGLAVFPKPLPAEGGDFNDLHQVAGLDAVQRCFDAVISGHLAAQAGAGAAKSAAVGKGGQKPPKRPAGPENEEDDSSDPFLVDDDGVWFVGHDQDGKRKPREWLCSRLDVDALTRDQDGGGWGYLLAFADPLGRDKQWAMPARMLSSDGGEYRAMLLNMGLRISTTPRSRNLLTQYIQTREPKEIAMCTDRIGWHSHAFVLPHETIGDDAERIVFQTDNAMENTFRCNGTADAWRERVGALCAGNSRLVFAVACAFAGPLLRPAGMESGGFHYRGDSSSGKTTALKVAASVYGGASYLQRWRTTDNALEAIAAQHSDCLLILDELAQVDPKTAGECAYMLANEQSKARSTRTGSPRARLAWRLLFLSAGELGLADHMAEGMKRVRTGQEVRMVDIPADAGAGLGAFETLHGIDGGAAFAKTITHRAASVHGSPGRAWLEWLCANADTLKGRIRHEVAQLVDMIPEGASGQVERVGARFVLVAAAGEIATAAGLTGWPAGESVKAARACFNAWLAARGGIGNGEVVAMLRAVRRHLESSGEGAFTWWHRGADDHNAKTLQRIGFRRLLNADGEPIKTDSRHAVEFGDGRMPASAGEETSVEYFIFAEAFKATLCQGFDHQAVARVLLDHGCLVPDKGRTFDCKPRLPGVGLSRCYRVPPAIFALEL